MIDLLIAAAVAAAQPQGKTCPDLVTPDEIRTMTAAEVAATTDAQLAKALELVDGQAPATS